MSNKFEAILFLGFIVLFLLGFIFAIIYIIVKSINSNSKLKQIAAKFDWYYYKSDKIHSERLKHLLTKLESTLYKTRSGLTQSISQILNGHYNSIEFWFSYYNAKSTRHIAGKGYDQNLSIYILPRVNAGSEMFLLHRTKMLKALPVEQILKKIGGTLEVPENPEVDWLLTSDKTALSHMALTSSQYHEIHNDFQHMYGIYLLDGIVVYMFQNYRAPKDIVKYLDYVYRINSIINP